jgi:biotin transporter BioY
MCVSSFVIGTLSDKGWSRSFGKTLLTCAMGSLCVYTFGVIVLANFLPLGSLFTKGVLPFIPGDILKSTLAATLASKLNSQKKSAFYF